MCLMLLLLQFHIHWLSSLGSRLEQCDDLSLSVNRMMVKNEEVNLSEEKHAGYFHHPS